ncbi:MAG: D-alanine--D-alanine ligase [Clostridiales bacterium]|nr:D-alanine--D-alanine ligase [Clostridiales bacterium]
MFGGRSGEHEISVLSAASVMEKIDRARFEPVPFGITKDGGWRLLKTDLSGLYSLDDPRFRGDGIFAGSRPVTIADFDAMCDFAFPLLHGPFGEDGTVQGLLEILDKPYAGCGVAASAISMDKAFTKEIWLHEGLPVCAHTITARDDLARAFADEVRRIEESLSYPIFVKPANMGSSVGITRAENRVALETGLKEALHYDHRVILEERVEGRELEVGLLGNDWPGVSAVGEVLAEGAYYDYDSKYRGGGTRLSIPAELSDAVREEIETLAAHAYHALDGAGFSRIDLFYDERRGKLYLSEMNAIPGFTQYSMFPLLWKANGLPYELLIERIIELGYERHHAAHHR